MEKQKEQGYIKEKMCLSGEKTKIMKFSNIGFYNLLIFNYFARRKFKIQYLKQSKVNKLDIF